MPTRIYSEEIIKKRKLLPDEKPTRKYTKSIKQEIKKEPVEMSDGDIDDDDVMDIEEADGTLPKKGKINPKLKRVMKTKKIKKIGKIEKDKEGKDITKIKPKRKKKIPIPAALITESSITVKPAPSAEISKPIKKTPKIKDKKPKTKSRPADSDTSPEESDAYETCGVLKCQRPSGKIFILLFSSQYF